MSIHSTGLGDDEVRGVRSKPDPITMPIADFCRASGLSRSKVYQMFDTGELEWIHVGVRRLVLLDSYRRLIEQRRQGGRRDRA
jgi:hypothetical protein